MAGLGPAVGQSAQLAAAVRWPAPGTPAAACCTTDMKPTRGADKFNRPNQPISEVNTAHYTSDSGQQISDCVVLACTPFYPGAGEADPPKLKSRDFERIEAALA